MIDKLRKICDELLKKVQNDEKKEIYALINNILKEDNCFMKIDIETSYAILRDLEIPEKDIEKVYKELIAFKVN